MKRLWIGLLLIGLAAGSAQRTSAALPAARVESLGTPVKSVRFWTTGLSPNARGGYNFIIQLYNHGYSKAATPEWVVLDLTAGKVVNRCVFPGYANSNYSYENQLRAANGRIFFSTLGNSFCYYDPATESVGRIGPLLPVSPSGPSFFYRCEFGPDGLLYASTQSNDGFAYLAVINPDTLEYKVFEKIGGKARRELLTYGYWLEIDPPWVYVCVGQETWSLVAVNTQNGESDVLAEVNAPYRISFNSRDLVRVSITSEFLGTGVKDGDFKDNVLFVPSQKIKTEYLWAVDGKLYPATNPPRGKKTFPPLPLTQTQLLPMGAAPELDLAGLNLVVDNSFSVKWRPAKAAPADGWTTVSFPLRDIAGITIDSLTALTDGTLLGNAKQYNGFFRYRPAEQRLEYYGKAGPSHPVAAEVKGKVYYSGYPNSVLFVYDPMTPWRMPWPGDTATLSKPEYNPRILGHFGGETGTHYTYFVVAEADRLYMAGRRERQGQGGGVGYYDIATGVFVGTYANLNFLQPRGFAVMPFLRKVVYSGELMDDPTHPGEKPAEAQLVVYDMELRELKRVTVKPGLAATGALYVSASGKQIIGNVNYRTENALYLFDMETEKMVKWSPLADPMDWLIVNPADGTWWGKMKTTLVQVNPATLEVTPAAEIARPLENPVWQGGVLYGTDGGELLTVTLP